MVGSLSRPGLAILMIGAIALTGCGAPRAAANAGKMFDKYGCLSRELKGETPCKADGTLPDE